MAQKQLFKTPRKRIRPKKPASSKRWKAELPCVFKSVNFTDGQLSIGLSVPRNHITVAKAEEFFCDRSVNGEIKFDPNSNRDADGQQTIGGDDANMVASPLSGRAKSFSVKRKAIGVTLKMPTAGIEPEIIARFASQTGKLCISSVEEPPPPAKRGRKPKSKPEDDDED